MCSTFKSLSKYIYIYIHMAASIYHRPKPNSSLPIIYKYTYTIVPCLLEKLTMHERKKLKFGRTMSFHPESFLVVAPVVWTLNHCTDKSLWLTGTTHFISFPTSIKLQYLFVMLLFRYLSWCCKVGFCFLCFMSLFGLMKQTRVMEQHKGR